MKKTFVVMAILICGVSSAQNAWVWSGHGSSSSEDFIGGICVDKNGDAYVIGDFGTLLNAPNASSITFGPQSVPNSGINQAFLVKYSGSNGNVIWSKGLGANNVYNGSAPCDNCEHGYRLAYDSVNNTVYLTGIIYGFTMFDTILVSGMGDMFFARIDPNGNFAWAKTLRVDNANYIYNSCIRTDKWGNVYLAGSGLDTMRFDNYKIPKGGYFASFNPQGNCVNLALQIDASFNKFVLANKDVYAIGANNANTNTISIGGVTYTLGTSGAYLSAFFVKMDTLTNVKSIKLFASSGLAIPFGISYDATDIYFAGKFQSNITIGPTTFTNSPGNTDMFVARYDTAGNFKWARQGNASSSTIVYDMVNMTGNKFCAFGQSIGTADFGTGTTTINGNFLVSYDSSGTVIGMDKIQYGSGLWMAKDSADNLFVTGQFQGPLNIGSNSYTATLTTPQSSDVFIAKHSAITGINTFKQNNGNNNLLTIYANPMAGKCNISVPEEFVNEKNLTLQIFDAQGKLLQNVKVEMRDEKIKLDLEAEAKGSYQVILSNGKKNYTGKIVFE